MLGVPALLGLIALGSLAALTTDAPGAREAEPGEGQSALLTSPLAASPLAARPVAPASARGLPAETRRHALDAYARLPLSFVPNAGQTDPSVRYHAQGQGFAFYFTQQKAVLVFEKGRRGQALELRFRGANPNPSIEAGGLRRGKVNYLKGGSARTHQTNLPTYGELRYRELWPGVDMVFRGQGGRLKYEFRLGPGADPRDVRLAYAGAEGLSLDQSGGLSIATPLGTLRDSRPRSYQRIGGERRAVESRFVLRRGGAYGFALGAGYDRSEPLVIDPSLVYSTYLGGASFDEGFGIAVDSAGSAYVTGSTFSPDFPTTAGAFDTSLNGQDAFVTKLNAAGSALAYSTYLGGATTDEARAIAVDSAGNAYVTGVTFSPDFPTTAGAFDTTFNGGNGDAFVTKLNVAGSALAYSTYLGGAATDRGRAIAVDPVGSAYVTGVTDSLNFPTTAGAFDTTFNGQTAFVTKLNAAGSALAYSSYLGGGGEQGDGIAVDSAGSAYVTGVTGSLNFPTTAGAFDTTYNGGQDAFVTKLNAAGSALAYSTYLGGASGDEGFGIDVDSAGSAYVTGGTNSLNFPTTAGAFQPAHAGVVFAVEEAFVTKLNAAGSALAYSSYLGGTAFDRALGIAVDAAGSAHVTGLTDSPDFPTTAGGFDTTFNGVFDAFVTKLNAAGSALVYSTFLGGTSFDDGGGIAVDGQGSAYVTGFTDSPDYPTTAGAFDTTHNGGFDAFVTKLAFGPGAPATVTLSPADAVNNVGTTHTVTATVEDASNQPVPSITVRFSVTGATTTSGSCVTNTSGQCSFSYQGPNLPGADLIDAYADTDNDNVRDPGEPEAVPATKAWVLPSSTEGQVTGGGQISSSVGNDQIAFGFNAKSDQNGVKGGCTLVDPSTDTKIKCVDATTVVVSDTHAAIFGNASVNGTATTYRIDVDDLAEPGWGSDTFKIQTASGYTAGGTLKSGNIQIH